MPRGDRSGPTGPGPGTGRSAGFCAGYGVYPNSYTQMAPQEEAKMVRSQIERLEQNIKTARERLGELDASKE